MPGCLSETFTTAPTLGVGAQAGTASLRPSVSVPAAAADAGFWELFPAICKLLNQLRSCCPSSLAPVCQESDQTSLLLWRAPSALAD